MPHGPTHAVRSMFVSAAHLSGPRTPWGTSGTFALAGCPERRRDVSGAGPLSVITFGVWQSLQPPNTDRYSPRRNCSFDAARVSAAAVVATHAIAKPRTPHAANRMLIFISP